MSTPPARIAKEIIIAVDLNISFIPNSFTRTVKVATQGKYMQRITLAITSCFNDKPRGDNIPTATSLRKNPIMRAPTASGGRPNNLVIRGALISR